MPTPKNTLPAQSRPRDREATRHRLIAAVGKLLAEKGFTHLGVNAVARQAKVDKVLIYRYFGGLPGLIKAFGQEGDFWPRIEELAGGDVETYAKLPLDRKLVILGHNFLNGIRKRPLTQEVLAWEMVERNHLTEELELIRERRMGRFAEQFLLPDATKADVLAATTIIGAGLMYLVCRARHIRWYNGLDLEDEDAWQRLETAMEQIVHGMMKID